MNSPSEQALRFLRLLYENKPETDYVLIWQLHGRKSHWFQSLESAANFAAGERDLYLGVGLSPQDYGIADRCKADDITGIAGLWADIDIAHPGAHRKGNLPPDEKAGLSLLKSMNAKPTAVVRSGYGLQAWWIFKEPWMFADAADRKRGAELAARWNQFVIDRAAAAGYEADSVGDLARIMRLPGTYNAKIPEDPRPVRMAFGKEDRRYDPSELLEIVDDLKVYATARPEAPGGRKWERKETEGLDITPNRQPPLDKFNDLRNRSRNFRDTLAHKRPSLKDQSTSGYDMSLACQAVRNGWTDQEITDLLIFHQRSHRKGGVRDRPEYFRSTIQAARKISAPDPALENVRKATGIPDPTEARREEEDEPEPPPFIPEEDGPQFRPQMLVNLSKIFKVGIKSIIRTMSEPPLYTVRTDRGEVGLGEVQNLIEQRALRNKIATIGVYLKKRKENDWEPIATALLRCCEDEAVTPDATAIGQLALWIQDYLRETVIVDNIADAETSANPLNREGRLLISSGALRKFLIVGGGERSLTARDLCNMLRRAGAEPTTVFLREHEGTKTSRHRWILPGAAAHYLP